MRKGLAIFLCLILTTTMLVVPANALRYNNDSKLSNADASFWGENVNDDSGNSVANVGDVNGDGYDDLLIGAYGNADGGSGAGETYLVLGKASGWAKDTKLSSAAASFWGEATNDESGYAVAGAGDVNGDGYDDFLIGAQWNSAAGTYAGQTYLIFGRATGWAMDTKLSKANASFLGEVFSDYSGKSVAGAGDVNGDGYDDLLIGALGNDENGILAGQAYLIFGKASGWAMATKLSKSNASFWGEAAGDWAGSSVAGVGDVNGDGFDDFLVGAMANHEKANGAGQTYLIFGKTSGWAMDTNLSKSNASFWGEQGGDNSGVTVAGAGDVNGDGYDDLMIGAYGNSDGGLAAGQTYLFFGKASGWAMDTSLSNANASFWGEHAGDMSGGAISGAGDVNGDGRDDIIISSTMNADGGSRAGQTYLVLGRSSGLAMDRVLSSSNASFWGEHANDYSGGSLAGGGDANGDGYDDILIGASMNSEGGLASGQTYLVFPDSNSKPSVVNSVKAYPNGSYSQEVSLAQMNDTMFIELKGTDGNASRRDIAVVNVTSNASSPLGFQLKLMETGLSTGTYRGNFTIKNRTSEDHRTIKAFFGETVTVSSVQDKSKKATVLVTYPKITLYPSKDSLFAPEDVAYKQHYWATGWPNPHWTFQSNASWLKWDNTVHNISGTPDNSNVGKFWVRVNISLGNSRFDEHNFTLTVNNTPPTITTNNAMAVLQDRAYRVDYNSTDDGQGHITWHLKSNAGAWLSINSTTGVLSGTPRNDDLGGHHVNVSVDDGNGGRAFENFTLSVVNTNDPPKILGKDITEVYEDAQYASNYSVQDIDKTDTVFVWTLKTNASWLSIVSATGKVTGTPDNSNVGRYWVNVTAKDPAQAYDFRNFTLTVMNVNDPPVWVDVPKDVIIEDTATYTFDVNATDIDVGDVLTYGITSAPVSTISINSVTGVITRKPTTAGTYIMNVSVTDSNATLYHEFWIPVIHIDKNTPPESTLTGPGNGSKVDILNPTLIWTVHDNDGDTVQSDLYLGKDLTLVKGMDDSVKMIRVATTTSFTPVTALDKGATYYWTVIPHDGKTIGKCTNGIWSFSISETASLNQLPKFVSMPSLEAGVGVEWTYSPKAVDEDAKDTVTYNLLTKPDGMTLTSGIIKWTPTLSQLGKQNVKVEATDGKGSVFQEFTVVVTKTGPSNHAPQISIINPITVKAGQKISIQITATDQENDPLRYSLVGIVPTGLYISPTGQLTWVTKNSDEGTHDIVIMVSDGRLSNTQSINMTVEKAEKKNNNASMGTMLIVAIIAIIVGAIVAVIILLKRKGRGKEPTTEIPAQPQGTLPTSPPSPPTTSQEQSQK
jgi:heme/copper-type cytochrome/quinol oxidase subunit 2